MSIHIYTAPLQPATRYVDRSFEKPMWFRCSPRRLIRCWRCNRLRWASKLEVQVYYDEHMFWCKDKKCKKS